MRIRVLLAAYRTALVIAVLGTPLANAQAAAPAQAAALLDDIDAKACHMASHTDVDMELGFAEYLTKALILPNGDRLHFEPQHDGSDYLELTDKDGAQVEISYPDYDNDSDDINRFADRGIRLLPFMGRSYVLHYAGSQSLYLDQIDRVDPGRSIAPICRFRPNVIVSLTPAEDYVDAPLCDRIQKGQLHVVRAKAIRNPRPIKDLLVEEAASMRVDFLNIGRPMTLIRSETSPKFGVMDCNSSLLTLKGKASTREIRILEQLQDKKSNKKYVPGMLMAGCADEPARWLTDNKHSYLEMRSHDYDDPVTEDSEYWFVSSVKKGRVHRVCDAFHDRRPPILASLWNGKTWVPAVEGIVPARN